MEINKIRSSIALILSNLLLSNSFFFMRIIICSKNQIKDISAGFVPFGLCFHPYDHSSDNRFIKNFSTKIDNAKFIGNTMLTVFILPTYGITKLNNTFIEQ